MFLECLILRLFWLLFFLNKDSREDDNFVNMWIDVILVLVFIKLIVIESLRNKVTVTHKPNLHDQEAFNVTLQYHSIEVLV
jgi:hypothetical protein